MRDEQGNLASARCYEKKGTVFLKWLALAALLFALILYNVDLHQYLAINYESLGLRPAVPMNKRVQVAGRDASQNETSDAPATVVNGDAPYCTGDRYQRGAWIRDEAVPRYDPCTRHLHRNCAATDDFNQPNGSTRIDTAMKWNWHPFDCKLRQFSAESMVDLLSKRNRKIRYVGDSLNHDMSQSMQCLLGEENEHLVSHLRDERLGCPHGEPHVGNPTYCSDATAVIDKWRGLVRGMQPNDILVVNTGAHWFGDPMEKLTAFRNIAGAIATVFNGTVISRTTVMGHDHCEKFLEPTSQFIVEPDSGGNDTTSMPYNWKNFSNLNGLVHDAFLSADMTGYHPLYVDMFEQRADGHVQNSWNYDMLTTSGNITLAREKGKKDGNIDCLHYCVPGPIHVWNELLYHLLYEILIDEETA